MVSPLSMVFSQMCLTNSANSAGRPRRGGKGTLWPSDSWISGGQLAPIVFVNRDAISISSMCGAHQIILVTGAGDWTQPDSIQAQEILAQQSQVAFVNSGNSISFDGPILAIWPDSASGGARAVVRNLATDNYEAYIVTAACTQ